MDTLWALSYISDGGDERIRAVRRDADLGARMPSAEILRAGLAQHLPHRVRHRLRRAHRPRRAESSEHLMRPARPNLHLFDLRSKR